MTAQKKATQKTGEKPSHFLKVKSEQFGSPINFTIAALWENKEKEYMGVSLNSLTLVPIENDKSEHAFEILMDTKIQGQEAQVTVGYVARKNFRLNLGDLVIFPNNYSQCSADSELQP